MASSSKAQGEPSQAPASDLHSDMHALVGNEYGTNDTPPIELKRATSPRGDSTTEPKRPKPTPAGPEKNPTGPPNPTPPAGAEVAASPNLTPSGPKINPRASPGGLLATEFMVNLQKTVDTIACVACARSSKDSVFTETVREQIKEVNKTAGRIYDHMEWVDKARTNSVATLNLLHTMQQWSTAIHEELSGVSRQLTNLSDMLKQVLDCMHTFSEAPPAPTYQAPPPYGYPPMWGNAPGAPYYAHPPAPVNPHDPRTRPAPIPPVVSQSVTPAPPAPIPVSQAAPVASAPVSPTPPVSGNPVTTQGDPKPTAPEGAAATSTGADTGAAPKRLEEYPTEQILVIETTSPDHFLTEFLSYVQKPLLAAGFARRTLNHLVKSWRLFTKRGYPKCTWAMCFGSVEDTNAAWAEYEGLRTAVAA
jgi:hypothetical protein